ncbi:MAG: hypothetical protein RL693_2078 [Verrucomicrobiota bacterium]|jgi:integrase
MEEHTEAPSVNADSPSGKFRFPRKRRHTLKIVEEVINESIRYKVNTYIAGKRSRRYFSKKTEAESFIATQNVRADNIGTLAKHMNSQLANDAAECAFLLKPYGARLLDCVREWTQGRDILSKFPGVPLTEAASHYATLLSERQKSWTVDEAASEWLVSLETKSARYQDDASKRLTRLREIMGSMSMADVSQEHIQGWLKGLGQIGAQTTKNYLTVASTLFAFAMRRKKAPRNPVLEVDKPEVIRGETGILTPAQLAALLTHLPDDTKAFVVLSAFAGLRPSEAQRLDWQDINFESSTIVVGARKAKTKRRRVVPMTQNLAAWLKPLAKEEGRVVDLSDMTIREKRLKPARAKAKITHWPHDCLRHSAATYWLETEKDSARVALWLGHDQSVLHEHYKGLLANPKDAEIWFKILPA